MLNMAHYICPGECHGVSMEPGTCQAADCSKKEQPLLECQCLDGAHQEVKDKESNSSASPEK